MGVKLVNRNKGIFIYGITEDKEKKIRELTDRLGLKCIRIPDWAVNEKIGNIVEMKISDSKKNDIINKNEVLIFSGLSDSELDTFLMEYKKAEIPPVGLKAIVTASNLRWTLDELIKELIKERAAIVFKRI